MSTNPPTLTPSPSTITKEKTETVKPNPMSVLARSVVVLLAISSLFLVTIFLMRFSNDAQGQYAFELAFAALFAATAWGIGYRLLLPPHWREKSAPTTNIPASMTSSILRSLPSGNRRTTQSADNSIPFDDLDRESFARYTVGMVAVALGGLGGAIILWGYGYLDEFIIIFPVLAFFPFSYLAYVTFQRAVRIKSLQIDFDLLGIPWDENLGMKSQSFWRFALHIILAMAVTILGLFVLRLDQAAFVSFAGSANGSVFDPGILRAVQFGFLGSYLFSVQLVYRRYTTYDLHPTVYLFSAVTILAGIIFNLAAFSALTAIVGGLAATNEMSLGDGLLYVLAFGLGYFPFVPLQWFSKVVTNALGLNQRRSEGLPLDLIDGISQLHEARLHDHGVDNVQNLAAVDLPLLLINSTFSAQQVFEWVDQAILYLYLGRDEIANFTKARIRTVSDFRHTWKPFYKATKIPVEMDAHMKALREKTALQFSISDPLKLDLLYEASDEGPNVHYIVHYWKNADFRHKVDYLFQITNAYSPKYSYVFAQAFLNYAQYPTAHEPDPEAEQIWTLISEIWDEIDEFPLALNKKISLHQSMAWAGLAYLKGYFASTEDLASRQTYIKTSVEYYHRAVITHQEASQHILSQIEQLPEQEVKTLLAIVKRLASTIQACKTGSEAERKACVSEVCITLGTFGDYLRSVVESIEQAYMGVTFNEHLALTALKSARDLHDWDTLKNSAADIKVIESLLEKVRVALKIEAEKPGTNGTWFMQSDKSLQPIK